LRQNGWGTLFARKEFWRPPESWPALGCDGLVLRVDLGITNNTVRPRHRDSTGTTMLFGTNDDRQTGSFLYVYCPRWLDKVSLFKTLNIKPNTIFCTAFIRKKHSFFFSDRFFGNWHIFSMSNYTHTRVEYSFSVLS